MRFASMLLLGCAATFQVAAAQDQPPSHIQLVDQADIGEVASRTKVVLALEPQRKIVVDGDYVMRSMVLAARKLSSSQIVGLCWILDQNSTHPVSILLHRPLQLKIRIDQGLLRGFAEILRRHPIAVKRQEELGPVLQVPQEHQAPQAWVVHRHRRFQFWCKPSRTVDWWSIFQAATVAKAAPGKWAGKARLVLEVDPRSKAGTKYSALPSGNHGALLGQAEAAMAEWAASAGPGASVDSEEPEGTLLLSPGQKRSQPSPSQFGLSTPAGKAVLAEMPVPQAWAAQAGPKDSSQTSAIALGELGRLGHQGASARPVQG